MSLTRRSFLASLGAGAALLASGGISLPSEAAAAELDATLVVGDVITIAGRFAVNPVTRRATKHLRQFVVTTVTSGGVKLQPDPGQRFDWETITPLSVNSMR